MKLEDYKLKNKDFWGKFSFGQKVPKNGLFLLFSQNSIINFSGIDDHGVKGLP